MSITIIGLGPGDPKYLTVEAQEVLEKITDIYVRSSKDPSTSSIPSHIHIQSFDAFYQVEHADGVYVLIAKEVVRLAKERDIVYAVPGDPRVGEHSVDLILRQASHSNVGVKIVHGVSFFEPIFNSINYDPFHGIQIIMADELASQNVPNLNSDVATLITMIIWPVTTSLLYEKLRRIYHQTQHIIIVERAGTFDEKIIHITLNQLKTDIDIHPLSCIFIPASDNPSFLQLIDKISKADSNILAIKRKTNKMLDYLASIDTLTLGELLKNASDELPSERGSNENQSVRWKTIQYLIGRFVGDIEFRELFHQNPQLIYDEFILSEREKLLLSILNDWDEVVGE